MEKEEMSEQLSDGSLIKIEPFYRSASSCIIDLNSIEPVVEYESLSSEVVADAQRTN